MLNETRMEIEKDRHKGEIPLYVVSIIITATVFISIFLYSFRLRFYETGLIGDSLQSGFIATVLAFIFFIVFLLVLLYLAYGRAISGAVKVSEKNFPEIKEIAEQYASKLKMKKVPEVYIIQQNGLLNAFAAKIPGRHFIQINAEIIDVAYMENHDMDTVSFVIAHEIAHHYLNHTRIMTVFFSAVIGFIPILGATFNRTKEYSADRVAQTLMQRDCAREISVIIAGRHLYRYVDPEDYLENSRISVPLFGHFAVFFINMLSTHPVPTFRMKALLDKEKRSGHLFFY